jgi:hypothetical protein
MSSQQCAGRLPERLPASGQAPAHRRCPRQVASKVSALKGAAEKAYGNREFAKALEQWEQAAKLLPEGAHERVDLFINRASAYYAMKK